MLVDSDRRASAGAVCMCERRDADRVLSAPELAAHWQQWAGHRTVWHLKDGRELRDA